MPTLLGTQSPCTTTVGCNDKPNGIHQQVSILANRISVATEELEKLVDRVRGIRPECPSDTAKLTNDPSTSDLSMQCHRGMDRLETEIAELRNLLV